MQRHLVVALALLCGRVHARLGGSGATDSGGSVDLGSLGNDWDKLITDMGDTAANNVTDTLTKLVDPTPAAKALLDVAKDKPDEPSMEADVWKVTGLDFQEDTVPAQGVSSQVAAHETVKAVKAVEAVKAVKAIKAVTQAVAGAPVELSAQAVLPAVEVGAKANALPHTIVAPEAVRPDRHEHVQPAPPPAKKQHLQVLDIGAPSRSSHASDIVTKVLGDKLDEANTKIAALENQLGFDKKTMDTSEAKRTASQQALEKKTEDSVNAAQAKLLGLESKKQEEEAKLAQAEQDSQGYKNQVDAIAKQLVSEHKIAVDLRAKLSEGSKPFALEVKNLRVETVALRSELKKEKSEYQELNARAKKLGHIAADIDESRHKAKRVAWKSNGMLAEADAALSEATAQNQQLKRQNKELEAKHLEDIDDEKKLQALKTALQEHKAAKVAIAKAEEAIKEAPPGEPVDAFTKVAAEAAVVRDRSRKVIETFVKETVDE